MPDMAITEPDLAGKTGPGGMMNFDALRNANLRTEPYNYFVAEAALTADEAADVRALRLERKGLR